MKPLVKANRWKPVEDETARIGAERWGVSLDEARRRIEAADAASTFWVNDLYQVQVTEVGATGVHLNIRRRDGKPIFRDWRHFQAIKNQLIGPECEAIELYPAESRLVDSSNKYHLWGYRDPLFRFAVGFTERDVVDDAGDRSPGRRQRPLNPDEKRRRA